MPNIVMPVYANLWIQVLLESEIYITVIWAIAYLVLVVCSHRQRQILTVFAAYLLALIIGGVRIYSGFVLNLFPSLPHPKWLFVTIVGLCLPLISALWYIRWALESDDDSWIEIVWNMVLICIGLEIIVFCLLWPRKFIKSRDWPNVDTLQPGRQYRPRIR